MKMEALTVRATVTNRVAPSETTKLQSSFNLLIVYYKRQSSQLQLTSFTALWICSLFYLYPRV